MPIRATTVAVSLLTLFLAADLHAPRSSLAAAVGGFLGGDPGPAPEGIPYSEDDFIEGAPKVASVRLEKFAGPEGRLRLEVTVKYPDLQEAWDGLIPDKADYVGRVNVVLGGCGEGANPSGPSGRVRLVQTHALPMDTSSSGISYTHVFQLTPEESARLLSSAPCGASAAVTERHVGSQATATAVAATWLGTGQRLPSLPRNFGKVLVDVSATASFDQFGDGNDDERARVRYRSRVNIGIAAPRASLPFVCTSKADTEPSKFPLTGLRFAWAPPRSGYLVGWMNEPYDIRICATDAKELPPSPQFEVFSAPEHGTASNLRIENGYLKVTYTPQPGYVGDDSFGYYNFPIPTQWDQLTVNMRIKPFVMGAIGDSITAGWGYVGGTPAQISGNEHDFDIVRLKQCEPLANLNNRCSSNAFVGPGDERPLYRWSPDAGLAANVSWTAQFANRHGIQRTTNGLTTFDNRAVSGARPEDWGQGGVLYRDLEAMLQNNLTVLTLGANPMLANTILDTKLGEECARIPNLLNRFYEVSAGIQCMQKQMETLKLYERLRAIYRRLLDGPRNRVVVMLYGLTYPIIGQVVTPLLANYYSPWNIEAMANEVNATIKRAVEDEAKLAREQGKGDRLFWVEPGRFNMGLPSYNQVYLGLPGVDCPTFQAPTIGKVDGTSNQSKLVQTTTIGLVTGDFITQLNTCPSANPSEIYFESLDGGLHMSRAGHKRFADALDVKAKELNLPLPLP